MSQKDRISFSQARALYDKALYEPLERQAEREQVAASEAAKAHREAMIQEGAARLQRLRAEISAYTANERKRRQRKNAAVQFNGPTPERASKSAEGVSSAVVIPQQGPVQAVKSHTIVNPIDRYRAHIPNELEAAARQLVKDFLLAETGPRMIGNYQGVGGSVPGARHGGVSDHVRDAQLTVSTIRAEWHDEFVKDVEWFVTQVVTRQDGSAMKFEDAGARINPPWRSQETLKGIGWGGLYRTLCLAAKFYGRRQAAALPMAATPEQVTALMRELRARAQQMREREARRKLNGGGRE